jgi:hypothetical protein
MISRTFLTCAVALALQLTANAAIEFSTTEQERSLEGIKFKLLYFKDNGKTIWYQPPRGWSVSGGAGGIRMTPPGLAQAQGEIEQSPLPGPQPLDADTMKALQQKALASVPAAAAKPIFVSEEKSPIKVNGNETYAVTVSYQAFGQEFLMSVLYLNLPDTQVRFRATARKQDFEKVHGAVRSSIVSWQWVNRPAATDPKPLTASK